MKHSSRLSRMACILLRSEAVTAIVYKVDRKSGAYVRGAVIPPKHSAEAHLGWVDRLIVGFLVVCAVGLAWVMLWR